MQSAVSYVDMDESNYFFPPSSSSTFNGKVGNDKIPLLVENKCMGQVKKKKPRTHPVRFYCFNIMSTFEILDFKKPTAMT